MKAAFQQPIQQCYLGILFTAQISQRILIKCTKKNKEGSLPLNILKKLGYKINVYTSADMKYFQMDTILFGKDKKLVDNFNDLSTLSSDSAIRDYEVIQKLKNDLVIKKDSNVFLIFLDSTHSEYSWHENFKPKFHPYLKSVNYLALSQSKKDLPLLKNRYKNALSYIDDLFGQFLTKLKENNLYDNSIILFTGDHGEEFYENGSLFHSSNLCEKQISVPIIYKLLNNKKPKSSFATHIDIFPTILSEISKENNFNDLFDGRSIFQKDKNINILSIKQNGAFFPNEVFIINENKKIHTHLKLKDENLFVETDANEDYDNNNTEIAHFFNE